VVEKLAMNDLVISPETYVWGEKEVELLIYILTPQGLRMGNNERIAIQNCQIPKSISDVE
jgi:hypothetical protein